MTVNRGASRGKIPRITWGASFANSLVFAQWLDAAVSYGTPHAQQEASGVSGAHDVVWCGQREYLQGQVRRIPRVDTGGITGWEGATGWRAFLKWAQDLNTFRFIPDAGTLGTYWTVRLVEPMTGLPGEEPNRMRTLDLVLETIGALQVTGY